MSKQMLKDENETPDSRLQRVVEIRKSQQPKQATLDLQRRGRHENTAQRARHFLRIAKGFEA